MKHIFTVRVAVEPDPGNEADFWIPTPTQVAEEVYAQMVERDLDTGWLITDVTA